MGKQTKAQKGQYIHNYARTLAGKLDKNPAFLDQVNSAQKAKFVEDWKKSKEADFASANDLALFMCKDGYMDPVQDEYTIYAAIWEFLRDESEATMARLAVAGDETEIYRDGLDDQMWCGIRKYGANAGGIIEHLATLGVLAAMAENFWNDRQKK
jgi:hypothetical protein